MGNCPLCKRAVPELMEKHHLKTRRNNKKEIVSICRECHKTIHSLFRNQELRKKFVMLTLFASRRGQGYDQYAN